MTEGDKARRLSVGRAVQGVVSLTVVGLIFFYFLPKVVDYEEVGATVGDMTWLELVTLAVIGLWNQATYVILEVAARPGLTYWQALRITLTSTAISNTLPAGGALGVGVQTGMYTSFGFAVSDITISLMVTGVWNTFVKLGMPIIALLLLALSGSPGAGLLAAAVVGVIVLTVAVGLFGLALGSRNGALAVGRVIGAVVGPVLRLLRKPPLDDWGAAIDDFRRKTIHLLRDRWLRLTVAALVSHVTLYLVLLLTLRHVGVSNSEVSWQEGLAAFAFVRLISAVPITPGGLGVVELGMTAALVAAGGDRAPVVAAVLVFRALTYALPVPLGGIAYLFWRRSDDTRPRAEPASVNAGSG